MTRPVLVKKKLLVLPSQHPYELLSRTYVVGSHYEMYGEISPSRTKLLALTMRRMVRSAHLAPMLLASTMRRMVRSAHLALMMLVFTMRRIFRSAHLALMLLAFTMRRMVISPSRTLFYTLHCSVLDFNVSDIPTRIYMNIALSRFLHNHGNIATEGSPTLISNDFKGS